MNESAKSFNNELNNILHDCMRFCFLSRGKEFQLKKYEELEKIKKEAIKLKIDAIAIEDEDSANAMLSSEETINSIMSELKMWIAFKEDNPNAAWDYLIEAEMSTVNAVRAHPIAAHWEENATRLNDLECLLFPPMMFFSPGMIIKSSECSICGKEYGECNHVRGRAYMGRFCSRILKDVEVEEVSFVSEPASKRHRVTAITDNDVIRDFLTWKPTEI
ncbi:MAG: hypothetical protein M0Q47_03185 [Methanothrix sp.]|jgi:hypothetical protein|uniref:hypothetical protein n=1 Tax=Methanothrix sp. TaxID=90426 RepID=UPI0025D46193|nr:hypothetical protein [Methanothrix sp.]MCK9405407.1 hypothetical protein [Methanothrix sp.]